VPRFISRPVYPDGRLPKWPTGADCKSAGSRLLWFESRTYHHFSQKTEAPAEFLAGALVLLVERLFHLYLDLLGFSSLFLR
jgi:hypothetical protein